MDGKYHFVISRINPIEEIFRGEMSFTEARKFMDETATASGCVIIFDFFNDATRRWQTFKNTYYHGGRKVYDNGTFYILDPDYRGMRLPENQQWHVYSITPDGRKVFCQAFRTEAQANDHCETLQFLWDEYAGYKFIKEPSDIDISNL